MRRLSGPVVVILVALSWAQPSEAQSRNASLFAPQPVKQPKTLFTSRADVNRFTATFRQDAPIDLTPPPADPIREAQASTTPSERTVVNKKFWALTGTLYGLMIVDTKSTFDSVAWCPRCREANPYAAPFVRSGPTATYVAGSLFDVGVMYVAARMKGSRNPLPHHTWWALPVALSIGHARAILHNYGLRQACAHGLPYCR